MPNNLTRVRKLYDYIFPVFYLLLTADRNNKSFWYPLARCLWSFTYKRGKCWLYFLIKINRMRRVGFCGPLGGGRVASNVGRSCAEGFNSFCSLSLPAERLVAGERRGAERPVGGAVRMLECENKIHVNKRHRKLFWTSSAVIASP